MESMRINILRALHIQGWMSHNELLWLAKTAQNCKKVLEVGSCMGRSSRAIADHLPENGKLICVDPWDGEYYKNDGTQSNYMDKDDFLRFQENLADHLEMGKVEYFRGKFEDFITLNRFDLVFIDGDHRYEAVKRDIELARKFVSKDGIISGHDYGMIDWPGVKRAVDEVFTNFNKVGSIWWTRKF